MTFYKLQTYDVEASQPGHLLTYAFAAILAGIVTTAIVRRLRRRGVDT